jgi:carbonic anhydrase
MKRSFMLLLPWMAVLLLVGCTRQETVPLSSVPDTPEGVLAMLQAGNERFHDFHAIHPDQGPERMKELLDGQHPWAVVVSCSDSRVVPELVFDQGLGDLFTVRTAGNVVGEYELASVEYAVEYLGAPLVIVMGHTQCGAINAFLHEGDTPCHGHMKQLVAYLAAEEEEQAASADGLTLDEATRANIAHGVHEVERLFREIEAGGHPLRAKVVGALYHIENGHVEWLEVEPLVVAEGWGR